MTHARTPPPVERMCSCLEFRIRNPYSGPGVCVGYSGCNLRPRAPEQRYEIMRSLASSYGKLPVRIFRLRPDVKEWRKAWYLTIRDWYYYGPQTGGDT